MEPFYLKEYEIVLRSNILAAPGSHREALMLPDWLSLLLAGLAAVAVGLALQSVLLWRWQRRLDRGDYAAAIGRAVRAALPDATAQLEARLQAATPALVDAAAQRVVEHLPTVAQAMTEALAQSLAHSINGYLGGKASGEVRLQRSQEGQLAAAVAGDADPIVGALLDLSPRVRRLVERNPDLVDALRARIRPAATANNNDNKEWTKAWP